MIVAGYVVGYLIIGYIMAIILRTYEKRTGKSINDDEMDTIIGSILFWPLMIAFYIAIQVFAFFTVGIISLVEKISDKLAGK